MDTLPEMYCEILSRAGNQRAVYTYRETGFLTTNFKVLNRVNAGIRKMTTAPVFPGNSWNLRQV